MNIKKIRLIFGAFSLLYIALAGVQVWNHGSTRPVFSKECINQDPMAELAYCGPINSSTSRLGHASKHYNLVDWMWLSSDGYNQGYTTADYVPVDLGVIVVANFALWFMPTSSRNKNN